MFISTVLYERLQELLANLMIVIGLMQPVSMPVVAPIQAETQKVEVIAVQEVKAPIIKELPPKKEVIKPKETPKELPKEISNNVPTFNLSNDNYWSSYITSSNLNTATATSTPTYVNTNVGVTLPELPVVELQKLDTPKMEDKSEVIIGNLDTNGMRYDFNDPYKSTQVCTDYEKCNYLDLGIIVRNSEGTVLNNTSVSIEATDSSQNKTLNDTGALRRIFVNGGYETVYYYPFHYDFKFSGTHTVTVTALGKSKSITVEVK